MEFITPEDAQAIRNACSKCGLTVSYVVLIDMCGQYEPAARFLSQALYWTEHPGRQGDGWFYKTDAELYRETRLTPRQLDSIRKQLRHNGWLQYTRKGRSCGPNNYRLTPAFHKAVLQYAQSDVEQLVAAKRRNRIPQNERTGTNRVLSLVAAKRRNPIPENVETGFDRMGNPYKDTKNTSPEHDRPTDRTNAPFGRTDGLTARINENSAVSTEGIASEKLEFKRQQERAADESWLQRDRAELVAAIRFVASRQIAASAITIRSHLRMHYLTAGHPMPKSEPKRWLKLPPQKQAAKWESLYQQVISLLQESREQKGTSPALPSASNAQRAPCA